MSPSSPEPQAAAAWYARIGVDGWATIVAGAVTALAVANLLPKIPW